VLQEIADVLEIKGESVFRIRSYRLGSEAVASHGEDVAEMVRRGDDLHALPGVGEGLASKLRELVATGRCAYHEDLLSEVPRGVLELLTCPGWARRESAWCGASSACAPRRTWRTPSRTAASAPCPA